MTHPFSTTQDTNPLLTSSRLPNDAPAFARISEGHFIPALEAAIAQGHANIAAIKTNPAPPDFNNVIVALEAATDTMGHVTSVFYNLLSAAGTDTLESLAETIGPKASNFSSDLILDPDLFVKVRAVYENTDHTTLTTEQRTLLKDTYDGFVRGGALLNAADKQRLRAINEQLSVLGPQFANTVKKSAEAFTLWIDTADDLAGLPATAIEGAKADAVQRGRPDSWLFTLEFPSYLPFMTYASRRDLRERIWRAFTSRGFEAPHSNAERVLTITRLRHERAQLLGFASHADFVLAKRMAKDTHTVHAFIDRILGAYWPAACQELEALKKFAQETDGLSDLKQWDVAYYSEKLKQRDYAFSSEDVRPFFPLHRVLEGTFTHFSKLFGVRFDKADGYETWHPDVVVYDVVDATDNQFLGTLFADFYPRKGKKEGAWKTSFRDQGLHEGTIKRPVVAIVCNFTKPTPDRPSLLTFDEVLTLFHEMGHAMHALLAQGTYPTLTGTNVLWDFVELPSQVQENWCYEQETLSLISGHHETGAPIPADLVAKIVKAKNFMVGWAGVRQMNFSRLDMRWHDADPSSISDVAAFEDSILAKTSFFPRLTGPASVSFSHIFAGGYAAGYYSYKWAEVLDADTFELFQERGLYDPATANAYRTHILAKGGSDHPSVLYRAFRGRDADPDALLRREGLLT